MPAGGAGAEVLSARGVLGEHDGHVPNYNIFGQQHHRYPTKDKKLFAEIVKEKPEWTRTPRHRTRAELFEARRAAKHPDLSYDLDGDGAVGATDYFIGKQFSVEQDHRLNAQERLNAVNALENGWLDNYSFGHDHFGAKRPFPVKQIRGKIISVDNIGDLNQVFPPHWNVENTPRFKSATEMHNHRRAEIIDANDKIKTAHDAMFPDKVPEPPLPRDPMPSVFGQSNSARKDARRREAREYSGLEPDNTHVNPNRELQHGTALDYIEEPVHKSRTAMRDSRKKEMREELHRNRREGEKDYVPAVARHTQQDAVEYDTRRPDPEALTMTKLKQKRRADNIEHNMRNFQVQEVENARYSEQPEAWWKMQKDFVHQPQGCALKELTDPFKDVAGKVTAISHAAPRGLGGAGGASGSSSVQSKPPSNTEHQLAHDAAFDEAQHKTLKRWSTEFVPQGVALQEPRFFDGVKQAPTYSMDTAELDQFSSFECIAKDSIRKGDQRKRKVAKDDEDRARSWKLSIRGEMNHNDQSGDEFGSITGGGTSTSRGLSTAVGAQKAPLSSREFARRPVPTISRIAEVRRAQQSETLEEAVGQDASMTERLDRIITGRRVPKCLPTVDETGNRRSASPIHVQDSGGLRGSDNTPRGVTQRSLLSPTSGAITGRAAEPQGLVVRTGGFQWIERQTQPSATLVEDASKSSLLKADTGSRISPAGSRSVSRTLQNKASPA